MLLDSNFLNSALGLYTENSSMSFAVSCFLHYKLLYPVIRSVIIMPLSTLSLSTFALDSEQIHQV